MESTAQLSEILDQRRLHTHFQPIVSLKRKALIGVEALCRPQDADGQGVSPLKLFDWARQAGRVHELDQECQMGALAAFHGLPKREPELLLFINVEASDLDRHPELSLRRMVRHAGIRPEQVVIEVNETQVQDQAVLEAFVARHRSQGFLIAMDDLGSGHSSLQRWPLLKPDIIKLDRALVDGVAHSFFAQQLLRSLIDLGRQTGALVLAEGVETEADVAACADLGVDLFQGYYFARPAGEPFANLLQALDRVQTCAGDLKARKLERMAQRRDDYKRHRQLARDLADVLCGAQAPDFNRLLEALPLGGAVESLLLLTEAGLQCTDTFDGGRSPRAGLFQPPKMGADHSDRDYYYGLMETDLERDCFLSEPHASPTTGRLSRTLSHRFQHPDGGRYIACLEIGTA